MFKKKGNYINGNGGLKFGIRDYKSSIFNYSPFWGYNYAKEDVFNTLFEFFLKYRGEKLIKLAEEYKLKMDEIVQEIYKKKKYTLLEVIFLTIFDKNNFDKPQEKHFEFREKEYFDLIDEENLKNLKRSNKSFESN